MAIMSSEEALSGIFNILETMIAKQEQQLTKTLETRADETIINLLLGMIETAKSEAAATAGEQLEKLSKGLISMKDIDNESLDNIAISLSHVNNVLNTINVKDDAVDNIDKFIEVIGKIGNINAENSKKIVDFINNISLKNPKKSLKDVEVINSVIYTLNQIALADLSDLEKHLNNIKVETSKKIVDFINNISLKNPKKSLKDVEVINSVIYTLNQIALADLSNLEKRLDELDIGAANKIGLFIGELVLAIKKNMPTDEEVIKMLKPLGNLMGSLNSITNMNISLFSSVFAPLKGYLLGIYVSAFVKLIIKATKDLKVDESIKYLGNLFDPLAKLIGTKTSFFSIWKLKKVLNKDTANDLADFFKILVKEIPDNKTLGDTMKGVNDVLKTLFSISILDAIAFNFVSKLLTEKSAENINKFITKLLDGNWNQKKLKEVTNFMKEFRFMLLTLVGSFAILVALVTFAPVEAVMGGLGILVVMVAGVIGIIKMLEEKKFDDSLKHANKAILGISLMIFTLSLSLALITTVVANNEYSDVAMGLFVLTLVVLGSIGIIWGLNKIKPKDLGDALMAMAGITAVYALIAIITATIIIPIGKQWDAAALGGFVTLGIVGVLVLLIWGLNVMKPKQLGHALLATAAMALILAGVALITKEILIPIGHDATNAMQGAGITLGLIGIMGGIMFVLGVIMKTQKQTLAEGAIVMAAIAGILYVVSKAAETFVDMMLKINQVDDFVGAGKKAAALIGGMGLIMFALGALMTGPLAAVVAIAIAAGAALLTGISIVVTLLSSVLTRFIGSMSAILKYSQEDILKSGDLMITTIDVIGSVIEKFSDISILDTAKITLMIPSISWTFSFIKSSLNQIQKINAKFKPGMMLDFTNIIIGKGNKDTNSLVGSLNAIIAAVANIKTSSSINTINMKLRPIFDVISKYIDIVMKVSTMNFISGYDDNGKPIFTHLPASAFSDAAHAITESFSEFITKLNEGFSKLDSLTKLTASDITFTLNPIINTVGKFVDVVMKVATGTYITGYDDNGKPEYAHLKSTEFSAAASAVANNFQTFIENLNTAFSKLSDNAKNSMKTIAYVMNPLMNSVAKFVDTVIKVSTMQIVKEYDTNGNPVYELIDIERFNNAGTYIATNFGSFMSNLIDAFNKLDPVKMNAIRSMKEVIVPIMTGVSSYADSIIKLAAGTYVSEYKEGKDGNLIPIVKLLTKEDFKKGANAINTNFGAFIQKLVEVYENGKGGWLFNNTKKALKAIGSTIGPLMEGIGLYVDDILKVTAGTYITGYDKNGKPEYGHFTVDLFSNAATLILKLFTKFITTLITEMNKGDFLLQAKNASDSIQDSIIPIMSAVKNFSDSLKPFIDLKNDKNKDYICLQPGKITTISTNIANGFTEFIRIIADNLNNPTNALKYADIKDTAVSVNEVMNTIQKMTNKLSSIIKSMKDDKGNVLSGTGVANSFNESLNSFITYFSNSTADFELINENATNSKVFIDLLNNIVKVYNNVLSKLASKDTPSNELIKTFMSNLSVLTSNIVSLSDKVKDTDFSLLLKMTSAYITIASDLIKIGIYMDEHDEMTVGINTFITNMNNLTSSSFNKNLTTNSNNLLTYTLSLKTFANEIEITSTNVTFFVTEMESARQVLINFDNELLDKEQKRNEALQSFADKLNNITEAITNMQAAFNALDENVILKNFSNIRQMLDLINTNTSENNILNSQNTQQANQGIQSITKNNNSNNVPSTNNTNNNYYGNNMPFAPSGRVVFEFKDVNLHGFYHI